MKRVAYVVRFLQFSNQACCQPHCCSLLSCLVLAGFPFYFQVASTLLNIPTAPGSPSQCFTFFVAPGLIACFLLLLKCSFQSPFFHSLARFRVVFSPVAFQMHDFWELNELRVHQTFTGGPSWSNCQFLAAPVWEHSRQTGLRSSSDVNMCGCKRTPFSTGF